MQDDRLYDEKELEKSWLISYSDLFTLLFVIIVIIAALHTSKIQERIDEAKKAEARQQQSVQEAAASKDLIELQKLQLQKEIGLLESKRDALVTQVKPPKTETDDVKRNMDSVKLQLAAALQEMNIPFEETGEGLMVRLPEKVLFSSGSAELESEGKKTIAALAEVLQRFPQRVRIEGYTDDVPVKRSKYSSNWELSAARAISVMRGMVDDHGLPASRFTVAGWGEHKPLVDNSNEENRAKNRRVEIVILAEQELPQ